MRMHEDSANAFYQGMASRAEMLLIRYSAAISFLTPEIIAIPEEKLAAFREEKSADFINCIAFGKTAEVIEKYVLKGTKIAVVGHIQTGSFTNKDGQKVYTTDVVIDELEFCESRSSQQSNSQPAPAPNDAEWMNIPSGVDESLPFN